MTGGGARDDDVSSTSSSSSSDEGKYVDAQGTDLRERERAREHLIREREEERRPGAHVLGQVSDGW